MCIQPWTARFVSCLKQALHAVYAGIGALVCLGSWSLGGLVVDSDVLAVGSLADVEGDEEQELGEGLDDI